MSNTNARINTALKELSKAQQELGYTDEMWKKARNELAGLSTAASMIFDKMLSKGAAYVVGTTALFYETLAGYQYFDNSMG